jgi:hypothetical protein
MEMGRLEGMSPLMKIKFEFLEGNQNIKSED